MGKNKELEVQIKNIREKLNDKLLQDINSDKRNSIDTLSISWELDKLIVDYMRKKEK